MVHQFIIYIAYTCHQNPSTQEIDAGTKYIDAIQKYRTVIMKQKENKYLKQ